MGFIFCGKHPPLMTRTGVIDPGPSYTLIKFNRWLRGLVLGGPIKTIRQNKKIKGP